MRGALIGAMLLEGLADDRRGRRDGAVAAATASRSTRATTTATVGPMAGVVSPSMWMFELRDPVHGGTAWCSLNEGLGKVLRYGAYGPEVVERLRWMSRRPRAAAADRGPRAARAGRRQGDRRPDAADGRRGAQPQPRRAR